MRVLYVLTSLGLGGAEKQTLAVAEHMAQRGHEVAFLVLKPRLEQEWPTTFEVIHLDIRRNPLSFAGRLWRAKCLFIGFKPDIVHSHGFHANIFARMVRLLVPNMVVVSTIHNIYEGGRVRMMIYGLTDGLSRRTIAVSAAIEGRFVQIKAVRRKKCTVIRNGIDMEEFAPDGSRRAKARAEMGAVSDTEAEAFVWLAVGRIAPAKDYPNLLRAFALARVQFPKAKLWIAGEDLRGELPRLQKHSDELGLSDVVRWLGLRRDIVSLLAAADAFVSSSAWEGMPLAVGEAMAMEKPVVATDVGGMRELVADAGLLVAAKDSMQLAEAMIAVMQLGAEERCKAGHAARSRVLRELNIEATAKEWERLYRELLR